MKHTFADARFRSAWCLVLGLALVLCISFGTTLNALGVFTLPIIAAFHCSHEEAAHVATVFLFAMTLAMPVAGWLLDRLAPRPVMAAGALLTVIGYLYAARSSDLALFTTAIALGGIGIGMSTYIPAVTLVSHWIPPRQQGLAFGILLAAVSLGGMVFPVLLTRIIVAFDWRTAMTMVAALIFCICLPLLLWLARMPPAHPTESVRPAPALGHGIVQALRMPSYWLWIAMLMLITMSSLGVYMALIPYLVSVGYSADHAALVNTGAGAATLAGNFLFGVLSARWGTERTLLAGTVVAAAGILFLLGAQDPALGLGAVALFALVWGSTFNLANQLSPAMLLESMGQRNFGSLLGIGNLIAGVGSAFGPAIVGYLVDLTHAYTLPLLLCAALMLAALLPIALLHGVRQKPAEEAWC